TADVNVSSLNFSASSGTQALDSSSYALRVNNSAQFGTSAALRLGGAIGGQGFVTFAGQLLWTAGGFEDGGGFTLVSGAALVATNTSFHFMYRSFNNHGSILWQAGDLRLGNGISSGLLNNSADGSVEIRSDGQFFSGSVSNYGLIQKTGALKDPSQFYTAFN